MIHLWTELTRDEKLTAATALGAAAGIGIVIGLIIY